MNLHHLNSHQHQAVLHHEGPLLILAGAGTGKTGTMAHRIAYLILKRGVRSEQILGLSFTNKAARELKERVHHLCEKHQKKKIKSTLSTFHSLCASILRQHANLLGWPKNFTIIDQNDQISLLRKILKHIRIDDRKFDLQKILFEFGQTKNRGVSIDDAKHLPLDYQLAASSAYPKYQEELKALGAFDFDDLLVKSIELLDTHADLLKFYTQKYQHILVDEYQDTNPTQFKLLKLLTKGHENLVVVGDDDQSIYSWRGANHAHILEFTRHYPKAKVITLDQNYRSTPTILDFANTLIQKNRHRHPKTLWSERHDGEPISEILVQEDRHEADFVAQDILRFVKEENRRFSDFALLYRSNSQSRIFEEAFRRHQVPYELVGGYSFLERTEVKDTLSYLRLVLNPKDDLSLRRVLNRPSRGIGRTVQERLGTLAFENQCSLFDVLTNPDLLQKLPPKTQIAIATFVTLFKRLQAELYQLGTSEELVDWYKRFIAQCELKRALEEDSNDSTDVQRRFENIEEIGHSLGQFVRTAPKASPFQTLRDYLHHMTLNEMDDAEENDQKDKPQSSVTFLTLHGSKGLEFPIVYIVGVEEGLLPHQNTLDSATVQDLSEERRLCYVGFTRAKDRLILTRSKSRIRYGKAILRNRSRFLDEAHSDRLLFQDLSHAESFSQRLTRTEHETQVKGFLSQIINSLKE